MAMRQPLDLRGRQFIETGFVQKEPSYPTLTAMLGTGLILAAGWLLTSSRKPTAQKEPMPR